MSSFLTASLPSTHPGEALFRHSLLSMTPRDVTAQDQIDRAQWLHAAGLTEAAQLLVKVAAVRLGLAPETIRWLLPIGKQLGVVFPNPASKALEDRTDPAFCVDVAVAELASILPLSTRRQPGTAHAAAPNGSSLEGAHHDRAEIYAGLDVFFERVTPFLDKLLGGVGKAQGQPLADLRAAIARASNEMGLVDISAYAGAATDQLAKLAAYNDLQAFLLVDGSIADGPLGSPDLLEEAERFSPGGLGVYFSNVERLVRRVEDLFVLIRLASRTASIEADVGGWCVLLSTHFSPSALRDLASALLQRGLIDALRAMIVRVDRQSQLGLDNAFLWHLRDASIASNRIDVARECQAVLAHHATTSCIEWAILSDICAVTGDKAGVESALMQALALDPFDPGTKARLIAFKAGMAGRYASTHGFFGAPERAHLKFVLPLPIA